jgi:Flp pilus assembly protein CpaB
LVTHDIALGGSSSDVDASLSKGDMSATFHTQVKKKDPITEVLLSNVRVMAVNQKSTAHGGDVPVVPSNVSLEVSASDAQKLRLVESGNGRLSLALRSLKDQDETELARPTGVGDLSHLTPPSYFPVLYDSNGQAVGSASQTPSDEEANAKMEITVVRGVHSEEVEVSRP